MRSVPQGRGLLGSSVMKLAVTAPVFGGKILAVPSTAGRYSRAGGTLFYAAEYVRADAATRGSAGDAGRDSPPDPPSHLRNRVSAVAGTLGETPKLPLAVDRLLGAGAGI